MNPLINQRAKPKLNLDRLTVPEKIEKSRLIVTSMTGNANFATPHPVLAAVTAAVDALETAYSNAQLGGTLQTSILHQKEELLDLLLKELGHYVDDTALGDPAIIISAGMDIKDPNVPIGDLPAPENLTAEFGSSPGEIDLKWDRVNGAKSYYIEKSPDPLGAFAHLAISTKASFTVAGLTSGTKYWFRVAAVGAAGQSPFSSPVLKMSE